MGTPSISYGSRIYENDCGVDAVIWIGRKCFRP